eukprot:365516-Chlamydomonas_euryale.AAC.9
MTPAGIHLHAHTHARTRTHSLGRATYDEEVWPGRPASPSNLSALHNFGPRRRDGVWWDERLKRALQQEAHLRTVKFTLSAAQPRRLRQAPHVLHALRAPLGHELNDNVAKRRRQRDRAHRRVDVGQRLDRPTVRLRQRTARPGHLERFGGDGGGRRACQRQRHRRDQTKSRGWPGVGMPVMA